MYVLLAGKHPFYAKKERTTKYLAKMISPTWKLSINCTEYKVFRFGGLQKPYPLRFAKDLVYKMCNIDAMKRYTAAQALRHPWITGYASKV